MALARNIYRKPEVTNLLENKNKNTMQLRAQKQILTYEQKVCATEKYFEYLDFCNCLVAFCSFAGI